ncbi:aspartate kinase [Eisenibacter elegans]|uniref:aspartate kinase n=1 Tax=Eisenibacter elegans TaxID=997 RepID=UPI00047B5CD2|nr:aspartate kinase [Eisenibacter elegans]
MRVLKFGGTSVGKPERMQAVAELVCQDPAEHKIVVLSALSGTTNALVEINQAFSTNDKNSALNRIKALEKHYEGFIKGLYSAEQSMQQAAQMLKDHFDYIRSFAEVIDFSETEEKILLAQGELMSTKLFHIYLEEQGQLAVLMPALEFMRLDPDNEPDLTAIEEGLAKQLQKYERYNIYITQGYICKNAEGDVDNLKRGGSDYTASLLGAAIRAEEVQIWTDIDGMHNNDPRIVKNTFPVAELSFDEAAELAYFGAKILHPATIHPAQKYNIPVRLLNTMQPEAQGTIIKNTSSDEHIVKSIAAKDGITAIKIKSSRMLLAYGFLRKVFEVFERYRTPIDMITTSEVAVSLTIDDQTHLPQILDELKIFGTVEIDQDQTIVCIVGHRLTEETGTAELIFRSLGQIPIRMISFGGSHYNISILIPTAYKSDALNALNEGLFKSADWV